MIPGHQKLLIGAVGAVALSILKLMSANFYIDTFDSSAALGAYLTYVGYLFLGMVVAYFLTEDHNDAHKTRRSAFFNGLLAPSILLAITTQPINSNDVANGKASDIQTLTSVFDWIVVPVHAQGIERRATEQIMVRPITKKDIMPGFNDGVKSALGIQRAPQESAVYVVGKTADKGIATNTATRVREYLQKTEEGKNLAVHVFKPDASDKFYVTIGDIGSAETAAKIDATIRETISHKGAATEKEKTAQKLLLDGKTYKGSVLFQGK